ncbi:hypothetical protein FLGE108171_11015 [Flavobacterium gelidilacus]|uniref:hypothetical protein n=1 Tax=Flavobacterium gelidilacus TaxID=206041 RepID=UPI00041A84B0|nr:hypothetical protein [Flavobacterium gelidilacus]
MKTIINKMSFMTLLMVLTMTLIPTLTFANETISANPNPEVPAKVQVMLDRLDEIKEMDKSELSRAEKKELRKEVRVIKSELRSSGNGVYLSVGAIIIIVLLLILLL